jgi:uncharacterized protein YcfJ
MNTSQKYALTLVAALVASAASAQVTLYESEGFQGRTFSTERNVNNLNRAGFNEKASSIVVVGQRWEVCQDQRFRGHCMVLRPGRYTSLGAMGLNDSVSSVRSIAANARINDNRLAPLPSPAQVIFYENENFQGRSFTADKKTDNFATVGFNDRASSVVVIAGAWEVCADSRFSGQCMVLRPGRYGSLASMGINNRISSTRSIDWNTRVSDERYAPNPGTVYDSRPRRGERLYEANVTSARAVVGPPEQRCWMEREAVAEPQNKVNVGGAVVGALLGGILGHQVGGGIGKDIATVGGAVAGAAVGARVGRNNEPVPEPKDVQRCTTTPSQAGPAFWDVSYTFRGQEHRVQTANDPGTTITVNAQGEPRT